MSFKMRKLLCAIVLVVGIPIYIVMAVSIIGQFERPSLLVELLVYIALGVVWAFPLKRLFQGIGRPDPDAPTDQR